MKPLSLFESIFLFSRLAMLAFFLTLGPVAATIHNPHHCDAPCCESADQSCCDQEESACDDHSFCPDCLSDVPQSPTPIQYSIDFSQYIHGTPVVHPAIGANSAGSSDAPYSAPLPPDTFHIRSISTTVLRV
jgi:hypothetical protein